MKGEVKAYFGSAEYGLCCQKLVFVHHCQWKYGNRVLEEQKGVVLLLCQVKSATTNKASGGDGIPLELFQILKGDAVKVLHSICQQIGKTQQWPQDWKRSAFIPIPKKGNAKEC